MSWAALGRQLEALPGLIDAASGGGDAAAMGTLNDKARAFLAAATSQDSEPDPHEREAINRCACRLTMHAPSMLGLLMHHNYPAPDAAGSCVAWLRAWRLQERRRG